MGILHRNCQPKGVHIVDTKHLEHAPLEAGKDTSVTKNGLLEHIIAYDDMWTVGSADFMKLGMSTHSR